MLRTLSRTNSGKPKRNYQSSSLFVVAARRSDTQIESFRLSPRIPLELIEGVIAIVIQENRTDARAAFSSIAYFALASRTFRQMAFRLYLRLIHLNDDAASWDAIHMIVSKHQERNPNADGFGLIKALNASSTSIIKNCTRLRSLTRLKGLRLCFEHEGLSTQHSTFKLLFPNLACSTRLSVLMIDMLPRIDRTLLSLISATFPCLETLHLSVTGRLPAENTVSWACFIDALECCVHSPIPHSHGDVSLLAEAYGTALESLSRLTDLQLGIFLSDESWLFYHLAHENNDFKSDADDHELDGIATSPAGCTVCQNAFGTYVRAREELASRIIFRKLNNLRHIRWSTLSFPASGSDSDQNGTHMGIVEFGMGNNEGELYSKRWGTC